MEIKPCPECGRIPKIVECVSYKPGKRRYMISCPNYCSVIKRCNNMINDWYLTLSGEAIDNNMLYRLWNESV